MSRSSCTCTSSAQSVGGPRAGETCGDIELRTHVDPVPHPCRPTSAPVLNRSYLIIGPSSIRMWGTPRGPIPQPDRNPPSIRHFRPLIPAHGGRRLHSASIADRPSQAFNTVTGQCVFPAYAAARPHHAGRRLVIPVAVTAGDKIEGLRRWASGRCLSADRAGVYSRGEPSGARVRRVVRVG